MPLIHCIVFLYSPQSDNVLEIPTHQGVNLIYRSNGNVLCIREIGGTNCSLLNIHVRKIERALRYLHILNIRLRNLVKQCLHALWRVFHAIVTTDSTRKLPAVPAESYR